MIMQKMISKKQQVIIVIVLSLIAYHLLPSSSFAADSSSSADIKFKLKALQEEIASRAANMKIEIAKTLQNKAYIGLIASKNNNYITISVKENNKNVSINEFTEYVIKSKTSTGGNGLKNITAGSSIAALGDIDDKGILMAKRIIKLSTPQPTLKKVTYGKVISISDSKVVLKTVHDEYYSIAFDKKTDYQIGKSEGSFNDIKINNLLIAVIEQSPGNNTLQAKFVSIFPYTLTTKIKK